MTIAKKKIFLYTYYIIYHPENKTERKILWKIYHIL